MIGFWMSAGAMVLMVALVLVQALRQGRDDLGRQTQTAPGAEDLLVYRDQLAEVDRDLTRGTLAPAEADRLRTEVQRRMLDADRAHRGDRPLQAGRSFWPMIAVVVLGLGAAAGLYSRLGAPGYPDVPLSERLALADQAYGARPSQDQAEAAQPPYTQPTDIDPEFAGLMDKLRAAVTSHPDDVLGQTLLAQNETALGNYAAARRAQQALVTLKGTGASAAEQSELASLMVTAAGGVVTPQAEQALIRTLQLDPRDGWARFYSGLMFVQIGRPDRTFDLWEPLLAEGPADAPWLPPIRDMINDVASAAGVDYSAPSPDQTALGPDAAAMAAAADMTEADRQAMIRTMVDGLEGRLMSEGGSLDEWVRLITSLGVLTEPDRARAAYAQAQVIFAGQPGELAALQAAAQQAGVAE